VAVPQAAAPTALVLQLQRTVGNAAVTTLLREPAATAPGQKTSRDNLSAAAETIAEYFINAKTAPKREALLTTRALIDTYLERLDGDEPRGPRVQDIPIE